MVQISMKKVEGLRFTLLTLERLVSLSAVIRPQGKGPARRGDVLVASLEGSYCTSKGGNEIVQRVFSQVIFVSLIRCALVEEMTLKTATELFVLTL